MTLDLPPGKPSTAPLSDAVAVAAANHGDRAAIVTARDAITWGEAHRSAEDLREGLAATGVGPGDVVALNMRSGPRWLVAATAVNRLGATIAGVSPVLPARQRSTMISVVSPRLVLADADLIDGLDVACEMTVVDADALGSTGKAQDHTRARAAAPQVGEGADAYAICFTSGTTGKPKAALFDNVAAASVMRTDLGEDPPVGSGGHMISSTQFAHVGFVLKAPGHALCGMTIHVMDRWQAAEAISLVARHRITTLGVVTPQLALMLRSPTLEGTDLSALRTVLAGGAPSPEALVREARRRLGVIYSIRWSSTESGGVGLAADVEDDDSDAIGTIGTPRPGVQARVADETGRPLPSDSTGELHIRSDALMTRYVGDPDATAAAFTDDGWLRTGDLARLRADGRFVIAGRRSEMYIRGGYNIHPQEVEAVLRSHPGVADVAVVPRPDDVMGQVGVAVVVPTADDAPPTLGELRSHAEGNLAHHQMPEAIAYRSSLPSTTAGKLDRQLLATEAAEAPPAATSSAESSQSAASRGDDR